LYFSRNQDDGDDAAADAAVIVVDNNDAMMIVAMTLLCTVDVAILLRLFVCGPVCNVMQPINSNQFFTGHTGHTVHTILVF
jgi:hypothetical protein